ncbi:MAG TPA: hypothetical protein VMV32_11595, partial [Ignavibacteriaceae bacterium]|nr:hypothetical protein [Ignavibacteriaceae bacterium]
RIKLGDRSEQTNLNLNAGVSSIEILIPDSSGCQIRVKSALSDNEFNGFDRMNKHEYQTANFDQAKHKIYLNLDAGISSVHVNRYNKSDWQ